MTEGGATVEKGNLRLKGSIDWAVDHLRELPCVEMKAWGPNVAPTDQTAVAG